MKKKTALITGVTGQDGSYLAKFLLKKNYIVHGIKRRSSLINTDRIDDIYRDKHKKNVKFFLHYGDVTDSSNINNLISNIKPDEIYNLAAQSHVQVSFQTPIYTSFVNSLGSLNILESIKSNKLIKKTKFYQASSSEMFGKAQGVPQNEKTPFYPRSPYGISKLYAHWTTVNYRESWDLHSCSGILFNHESPLRGIEFVTRKISLGMAEIAHRKKNRISLGNLNAERDWGFSGDYVKAMWMMLQQNNPKDYVIATGKTHSVREFAEKAAQVIDLEIEWMDDKDDEVGVSKDTGDTIITVNKSFNRPAEIDHLLGDSHLANNELGWKPEVDFEGLVEMMVQSDLKRVEQGAVWF